jgi:hypothetical protein
VYRDFVTRSRYREGWLCRLAAREKLPPAPKNPAVSYASLLLQYVDEHMAASRSKRGILLAFR